MTDKMHRVTPGGIFHIHKVKYSTETENLIRELIRESKLSIFQRKKVEESVRKGEPLPLPPTKTARGLCQREKSDGAATGGGSIPSLPRRRRRDVIISSGAYQRDTFTPTYLKANHEMEKAKLQEVMAFGRTLKSGKQRKPPSTIQFTEPQDEVLSQPKDIRKTQLDAIVDDIEERKIFLANMESIGQGKHYREIINQEIKEKLQLADDIMKKIENLKLNPLENK